MEKELKVKPAGVRSPLACMELAIMATFSILLVLWFSVTKLIGNEKRLLAPKELFFYPYIYPPESEYARTKEYKESDSQTFNISYNFLMFSFRDL